MSQFSGEIIFPAKREALFSGFVNYWAMVMGK